MSLLDQARARVDYRDLTCMILVEKLRHDRIPATAATIAAHIRGAPIRDVDLVLSRLADEVEVLDRVHYVREPTVRGYAVNPLGAELLDVEVLGWTPSEAEQIRRDRDLRSARVGALVEP